MSCVQELFLSSPNAPFRLLALGRGDERIVTAVSYLLRKLGLQRSVGRDFGKEGDLSGRKGTTSS